MGPLDLIDHLLGFLAPALAVAVLVALAGRVLLPKRPGARSWWAHAAINFVAGTLLLAAGLWFFGRDGKIASYAGLVLACATAQWLWGRGWRG
jgi:hypothetical protein